MGKKKHMTVAEAGRKGGSVPSKKRRAAVIKNLKKARAVRWSSNGQP